MIDEGRGIKYTPLSTSTPGSDYIVKGRTLKELFAAMFSKLVTASLLFASALVHVYAESHTITLVNE